MKTQYDMVITDSGRTETIDLSVFTYVTDVIGGDSDSEPLFFFNVIMQGGVNFSSLSKDKDVVIARRTSVLKARDTFLKKFYKRLAKLNAKAVVDKKEIKKRDKNVAKELSLLTEIRDALMVDPDFK